MPPERGLLTDVTQLHNLREAEPFIARHSAQHVGRLESNKLDGGIKSTNGHLMVIGGFMGNGDVIAYDPASPDTPGVSGMSTTAGSSRRRGSRRPAGSCTSIGPPVTPPSLTATN
jgi:hypothetical protein